MEKFHYENYDALEAKAAELGLHFPRSTDPKSVFARSVKIADSNIETKNSIAIHPMEGFDSEPDGAPSSGLRLPQFATNPVQTAVSCL